jgi:hypothetical protein
MADLSFIHMATPHKVVATNHIISNIRQYHPDAYYFLSSDGIDDLSDIAKKYNCEYKFYEKRFGSCNVNGGYGYPVDTIIAWLTRFYEVCLKCNTSHIQMVEDDVWLLKPVTVKDEWEMAAHWNTPGDNVIGEYIHDMIEQFSGKRPITKYFGAGGGTIFKVSTFIENYDNIVRFLGEYGDRMRESYPPFGSLDVFMVVYYFLCGKDYTVNPYMVDAHAHRPGFDFESFVSNLSPEVEIINNYKKWYWNE